MAWARGWRFDGLDLGGDAHGMTLTPGGGAAMVTDDALVRQALIMLLLTAPGERVMRPDYGCPLHRLVFEPNDDTTAGLAIHYVREAILRFEPRAEIVRLDAGRAEDGATTGNRLSVKLTYRARASLRTETLMLDVALGGPPQ